MLMRFEAAGVTAWSECGSDPDPYYAYETNTTARHIIRDFLLPSVEPGIGARVVAERVLGRTIRAERLR